MHAAIDPCAVHMKLHDLKQVLYVMGCMLCWLYLVSVYTSLLATVYDYGGYGTFGG